MSWTKLGDEFVDDAADLSDAAVRTHIDALGWSNRRLLDLRIPKRDQRRFAFSAVAAAAVEELVAAGWSVDVDDTWHLAYRPEWQRDRAQVEHRRAQLAEAQRRKRLHDIDDHSRCLPGRCKGASTDDKADDMPVDRLDDPGRAGTGLKKHKHNKWKNRAQAH